MLGDHAHLFISHLICCLGNHPCFFSPTQWGLLIFLSHDYSQHFISRITTSQCPRSIFIFLGLVPTILFTYTYQCHLPFTHILVTLMLLSTYSFSQLFPRSNLFSFLTNLISQGYCQELILPHSLQLLQSSINLFVLSTNLYAWIHACSYYSHTCKFSLSLWAKPTTIKYLLHIQDNHT